MPGSKGVNVPLNQARFSVLTGHKVPLYTARRLKTLLLEHFNDCIMAVSSSSDELFWVNGSWILIESKQALTTLVWQKAQGWQDDSDQLVNKAISGRVNNLCIFCSTMHYMSGCPFIYLFTFPFNHYSSEQISHKYNNFE